MLKTAVTERLDDTVTTQTFATAPGQVVLHDTKLALGRAVRVTDVPAGKGAPQVVAGQSIPAGELVIVSPTPAPCGTTLRIGDVVPPGQYEISGLLMVIVALPLTKLPLGPVPLS